MLRLLMFVVWFGLMAGIGVVVGCYIHGWRVNQTTLMSGVAFVRELPYGEQIVGRIETAVFSYQEKEHHQRYLEKHKGSIEIDPEVLKQHKSLYRGDEGRPVDGEAEGE